MSVCQSVSVSVSVRPSVHQSVSKSDRRSLMAAKWYRCQMYNAGQNQIEEVKVDTLRDRLNRLHIVCRQTFPLLGPSSPQWIGGRLRRVPK